jgi:tetratricopeptide (TPR) repeat protein
MGEDDLVNAIPNYYKSFELDETYWKPWNLDKIRWCFFASGFYEKATFFASEKLKLDADSIGYLFHLAGVEFVLGNLAKSLELHKKAYSMDSTNVELLNMIVQIYTINGEKTEALHYAILLDSLIVKHDMIALNFAHRVGYAYWINGKKERAKYYFDKQLNNCLESIKMKKPYALQKFIYYDLAALYAFYGDKEKALQYLEEYNTKKFQRSVLIRWLEKDPLFDSIRDDERFQEIQNEMEIKYQAEHDKLEVWMKEKGYI